MSYNDCTKLTSEQIIEKYQLYEMEIIIMKFMYKNQFPKDHIIQYFNNSFVAKHLGTLKKKD